MHSGFKIRIFEESRMNSFALICVTILPMNRSIIA